MRLAILYLPGQNKKKGQEMKRQHENTNVNHDQKQRLETINPKQAASEHMRTGQQCLNPYNPQPNRSVESRPASLTLWVPCIGCYFEGSLVVAWCLLIQLWHDVFSRTYNK